MQRIISLYKGISSIAAYTLEVENEVLLEEKIIEDISLVTIEFAKDKKNKFDILLHTTKGDKLLWTI